MQKSAEISFFNGGGDIKDTEYLNQGNDTIKFVNSHPSRSTLTHQAQEQIQSRDIAVTSDSKKLKNAIESHNNELIVEFLTSGKYGVNAKEGKNNNTAYHLAVLANNTEVITIFKQYGAHINEVNAKGDTPLILAVKEKANLEMISCLLENHANINNTNNNGYSALTFAIKSGDLELTKNLIKKGADVNLIDNNKCSLLFHAIKSENLELLSFLLNKCNNIDQRDTQGCAVIHLAIQIPNNIEIINLLLKHKADINIKDNNGKTAIHYAYEANKIELIEHLIKNGADLNAVDNCKSTIAHWLAQNNNHEVAINLLESLVKLGLNVNILDENANLPIYYAITNKNLAFINKLLNLRAKIFTKDQEGYSYLELILVILNDKINMSSELSENISDNIINKTLLACLKNIEQNYSHIYHHTTTLTFLIISAKLNKLLNWLYTEFADHFEFKFDPKNKDDVGTCPIQIAIGQDNLEAIKILLEHGADVNIPDANGRTSIHHAMQYKKNTIANMQLINLLTENKANLNAQDTTGNTALYYACENNNLYAINALLATNANIVLQNTNNTNNLEIILKKIETEIITDKNNLPDDIKNNILKQLLNISRQSNLIHSVIKYNCHNILEKLIELSKTSNIKINLEQADANSDMPIHRAVYMLDEKITLMLIKQAININAKNNKGMAAIHYAAKDEEKLVQLLLNCCARVDIEDKEGRTPLHHAIMVNNIKTIEVLIKNGADINLADNAKKTPLHYAVIHGSMAAMEILVKHKANTLLEDKHGRNPFHWAIKLEAICAIKFLYENNQDLSTIDGEGNNYLSTIIGLLS